MAIDHISIDGFSVFKETEIDFCEGINVIIGSNGTGKTHLLKFLYALLEATGKGNKDNLLLDISEENDGSHINGIHPTTDLIKSIFRPYSLAMLLRSNSKRNGGICRKRGTVSIRSSSFYYKFHVDPIPEGSYAEKCGSTYNGVNIHNGVFIPAKEMLTHSTLYNMNEKYSREMPYDMAYLKIIELARRWKLDKTPKIAENIVGKLETLMEGTVVVKEDGSFWMQKKNNLLIPFSFEADGLKRFGIIWQLLMNESINPNTILFWDEPENSINPKHIPDMLNIFLELQRHGMQIFFTTHNHNFANHLNEIREYTDIVKFISLKNTSGTVSIECADNYDDIVHNPITSGELHMYDIEMKRGLKNDNK